MDRSKRVVFENYTLPVLPELIYEKDSNGRGGEVLFIDDPDGRFLITLETGMPCIDLRVKERFPQEYICEEINLEHLRIHLCYPTAGSGTCSAMGYFHVEIMDINGRVHILPGQMRIAASMNYGETLHSFPVLRTLLNGIHLSAGNEKEHWTTIDNKKRRGDSAC